MSANAVCSIFNGSCIVLFLCFTKLTLEYTNRHHLRIWTDFIYYSVTQLIYLLLLFVYRCFGIIININWQDMDFEVDNLSFRQKHIENPWNIKIHSDIWRHTQKRNNIPVEYVGPPLRKHHICGNTCIHTITKNHILVKFVNVHFHGSRI